VISGGSLTQQLVADYEASSSLALDGFLASVVASECPQQEGPSQLAPRIPTCLVLLPLAVRREMPAAPALTSFFLEVTLLAHTRP
jgi:hypothetical protein